MRKMSKSRVIIADTDINYMIPLQLKFIKDFAEEIDLEVITDEDYFNELFLSPQRVDFLLVSDKLYDASLQRHSITNLFLMTEQAPGDWNRQETGIHRVYKYTSVREIFHEILSKSSGSLTGSSYSRKEPKIILVYSGCGGVGKTTVALGISECLTVNYRRVFYINADRMQTFQHMLGNVTPILENDVYTKLSDSSDIVYDDIRHVVRREAFAYLPPFKAALTSLGISYSAYHKIAEAAKQSGEYDYIVIDADIAFDEEKAALISLADKVIIVTTQRRSSVCATNLLVSNISGIHSDKYIFICNDYEEEKHNELLSSDEDIKFSVSDYIEHIDDYDSMKSGDLARIKGIQKTAFLIMQEIPS